MPIDPRWRPTSSTTSPVASQIELSGEHEIFNSQPQAVADQIFSLLDR